MTLLDVAINIATKAHAGQKRKNGEPYINHPKRVADLVDGEDKVVAWLHDTLEDTNITEISLTEENIPDYFIKSLKYLTRYRDESYYHFIMSIINNGPDSAIRVKIADIKDNMSDLEEGSMKDKYRFAAHLLIDELNCRTGEGCKKWLS